MVAWPDGLCGEERRSDDPEPAVRGVDSPLVELAAVAFVPGIWGANEAATGEAVLW
jgi:hypothetical protein